MRSCDWQSHSTSQVTITRDKQHSNPTYNAHAAAMDPSLEQAILNKYNLTTLWPTRWPDEKNDESDSDGEAPTAAALQSVRRSRSRFSVLEDRSRFSRQIPGAEISKDGKENLVQKDEQDPLGMYPSVVQVLRTRNVQVEEDIKLRRCL
jgi:exocyst complex component 2